MSSTTPPPKDDRPPMEPVNIAKQFPSLLSLVDEHRALYPHLEPYLRRHKPPAFSRPLLDLYERGEPQDWRRTVHDEVMIQRAKRALDAAEERGEGTWEVLIEAHKWLRWKWLELVPSIAALAILHNFCRIAFRQAGIDPEDGFAMIKPEDNGEMVSADECIRRYREVLKDADTARRREAEKELDGAAKSHEVVQVDVRKRRTHQYEPEQAEKEETRAITN
ncbi:hypothetical protein JCM10213v2_006859 [Rhodosporidiobolus nylandii]